MLITIKPRREVYTAKYYRHGAGFGIYIPPDIREQMKLLPGDTVVMRVQESILFVVKLLPEHIFDREKVARIFDNFFDGKGVAVVRNASG